MISRILTCDCGQVQLPNTTDVAVWQDDVAHAELGLHTYNYERTECIWCGPGRLASKPGRWVSLDNGFSAWSASESAAAEVTS